MINKCFIFTSLTCKDCFTILSELPSLENEFSQIEFITLDIDKNPSLVEKHKIYTLPSIELYEDDKLIAEFKHGKNKQINYIKNFIRVQIELRKETDDNLNIL